jgi:hypothetical protein
MSSSEPPAILRRAADDARYLLDRGYPKESAVRFVSDHYRLPQEQRFAIIRVVLSSELARARKEKAVPLEALRDKAVFVDGYNVLIAVESLLSGKAVYKGDDGFLRDTQGIFRSYQVSNLTATAISEILRLLHFACPARVEVLLDQQISMSGHLAAEIRGMIEKFGLQGSARTAQDVDHKLKAAKGIIATGDGNIIDAVPMVVDIPGRIAQEKSINPIVL